MNWMIVVGYKGENYDAEYDFVLEYPREEAAILAEAISLWFFNHPEKEEGKGLLKGVWYPRHQKYNRFYF